MTIQAKTPFINIFQVKPKSKKDNRFLGSSFDEQNPFLFLITKENPNVVSFESTFDAEANKSSIVVRVVDPNLELFQKFFSSFNYIGRIKEAMTANGGTGFEGALVELTRQIQGEQADILKDIQEKIGIDEDGGYSRTVINLLNYNFSLLRAEVDYTYRMDNGLNDNIGEAGVINNRISQEQVRDDILLDELGPLGMKDLNLGYVDSFKHVYQNKRFIVQYSDGTHDSLHFDTVLSNLRMFSSSDNLLMVDMTFTVGAQSHTQSLLAKASASNSERTPSYYTGVLNYKEATINIGRGLTTKVETGMLFPDIGPSIENKTITSFLDDTQNRVNSIQKCMEAAIGSFMYEFDHTIDIHNYLVFLHHSVNNLTLQSINGRRDDLAFKARNQTNNRFYRDKNGAYIHALKSVLRSLGFRVTHSNLPKKAKGTDFFWEGVGYSLHIAVDTNKTHYHSSVGNVGVEEPRLFVQALIQNIYATLDIKGVDKVIIQPAGGGSYFYKDILLNCLSQTRANQGSNSFDPTNEVANPLYYNKNDAFKFPLEQDNVYLKVRSKSYQNRPLIVITDSNTQNYLNSPLQDNETRKGVRANHPYIVDAEAPLVVNYEGNPAYSNLQQLINNGWLNDDVLQKYSNLTNIHPRYFETPVFQFNGPDANVLEFQTLDENYSFAFFKTQPPAFAKQMFYSPLAHISSERLKPVKDKFTKVLETTVEGVDFSDAEDKQKYKDQLVEFSNELGQLELRTDPILYSRDEVPVALTRLYDMFNNIISDDLSTNLNTNKPGFAISKTYFENVFKTVFEEFAREYSSETISVFGFLEYLELLARMNKFTHTLKVRTTPMFHIGYGAGDKRSCLFVGKLPNSPMNSITDPFDIGIKDLVYNGAYSIVGFRHVADESDCYSEFTLIKPGLAKPDNLKPELASPGNTEESKPWWKGLDELLGF